MKTICIVGASGYIGAYLSKYFYDNGYKVYGTHRRLNSEDRNLLNINWIKGDVTNDAFIEELMRLDFEYLVYCISLNHRESELDIARSISVNFLPFAKICEKLSEKPGFNRLIYFSTMQVLGKIELGSVVNNEVHAKPLNTYGLTHLMCEQMVSFSTRKWGLNALALRLSNCYGPPVFKSNDCWWLVVNDLCLSVLKKKIIELSSDGSPQRDFIHLSDVANAVMSMLKSKSQLPNLLNLCSGKTYTILELAKVIGESYAELSSEKISITIPTNSPGSTFHESSRIKFLPNDLLDGRKKMIPLKDGIKSLLLHLRDNFI